MTSESWLDKLQAIEKFMLDIEFENSPIEYPAHGRSVSIEKFFNKVCYNPSLFRSGFNFSYSPMADIFLTESRQQEIICDVIESTVTYRYQYSALILDSTDPARDGSLVWSRDGCLLSQFHNSIREKINSELNVYLVNVRNKKLEMFSKEMREKVERYFEDCPNLFVLCIDFGYRSSMLNTTTAPFADRDRIDADWDRFAELIDKEPGVIGHFEKFDLSDIRGPSLFGIFFCQYRGPESESYWESLLTGLWFSFLPREPYGSFGWVHNCNPEICIEFSEFAVGHIRSTEKKKREALFKWVIDPLTFSMAYLWLRSPKGKDIRISGFRQNDNIIGSAEPAFSDREIQNAWKLPKKSLVPTLFQHYQEAFELYPQIAKAMNQPSHYAESLMRIEQFVTFVRGSHSPAFHVNYKGSVTADPIVMKTRLGVQWHDLWSHLERFDMVNALFPNIECFSKSIQVFCLVLYDSGKFERGSYDAKGLQWDNDYANQCVDAIRVYFKYSVEALERVTQLKSIRVTVGRRIGQSMPHMTSHAQVMDSCNNTSQKLGELMLQEHRVAQSTYDRALGYMEALFKTDVMLLGFKFSLKSTTQEISPKQFTAMFTAFRAYGNHRKPMSWRLGIVGRWERDVDQCINACVIFVMDASEMHDIDDVRQQIIDYWQLFVRHKGCQIMQLATEAQDILLAEATPYPIFAGTDNKSDVWIINCDDKKAQRDFMQQVLRYIIKSPLYFQLGQIELRKLFIKGSLVTAKRAGLNKKPTRVKKTTETLKDKGAQASPRIQVQPKGPKNKVQEGGGLLERGVVLGRDYSQTVPEGMPMEIEPPSADSLPDAIIKDGGMDVVESGTESAPASLSQLEQLKYKFGS